MSKGLKRGKSQAFDQDGQDPMEESQLQDGQDPVPECSQTVPEINIEESQPDQDDDETIPAQEHEILEANGVVVVPPTEDEAPDEGYQDEQAEGNFNIEDVMQQLEMMQQVLTSMQQTIPKNKFTDKITEGIENMLIEITTVLSADVPTTPELQKVYSENMHDIVKEFRELKTMYDDIMMAPGNKMLQRRPTDPPEQPPSPECS